MVERRDAGCSHSQQYFSVRDSWFGMIDELQPFITLKTAFEMPPFGLSSLTARCLQQRHLSPNG